MKIELGLTIPFQRHLKIKMLPYGQETNRRFCWDLHVISLRGRSSLLAVHCFTRYTFVLYDLDHLAWERLAGTFLDGLRHSLSAAGFSAEEAGRFAVRLGTASAHQDPWTAGGSVSEPGLGGRDGGGLGSGRKPPGPALVESACQRQAQPLCGR